MNNSEDKSDLFNNSEPDKNSDASKEIIALHNEAIKNNEDTYIDPETGYQVFTAKYLLERDYCCDCGCRHCPY
jgi:ATP-binding cassette subfamily B (MDR/TAP) protein 1